MSNEIRQFFETWEFEAQNTVKLLRTLPEGKYDFRPFPEGRSLGELAWHLAEVDGYMPFGLERGEFKLGVRPANLERPRTIAEIAPGFERIHREAVEGLRKLDLSDLDRQITFFDGKPRTVRVILWYALIHHQIHHRGQLALMIRLAGGTPAGMYGPTREEMAAMRG